LVGRLLSKGGEAGLSGSGFLVLKRSQAQQREPVWIALVHKYTAGRIHLLGCAYRRTRAEAGMLSPVIRLRTLQPIFVSVR